MWKNYSKTTIIKYEEEIIDSLVILFFILFKIIKKINKMFNKLKSTFENHNLTDFKLFSSNNGNHSHGHGHSHGAHQNQGDHELLHNHHQSHNYANSRLQIKLGLLLNFLYLNN